MSATVGIPLVVHGHGGGPQHSKPTAATENDEQKMTPKDPEEQMLKQYIKGRRLDAVERCDTLQASKVGRIVLRLAMLKGQDVAYKFIGMLERHENRVNGG